MDALLAPLAIIIERTWGYPSLLLKTLGHPVMWFGALIALLDRSLNKPEKSAVERRDAGVFAIAVLLLVVLVASLLLTFIVRSLPFGWVVEALLASTLLAQKQLGEAVAAVAEALRSSLAEGRLAVSPIVGRDPENLDEAGVARAAIETLAENASDGVVAPLFWLMLFGLPGIALYKALNTADSMIGHKTERYREFGWASARFDDLANLVPARLTAGLIVVATFFVRGASPSRAWAAARRDAPKHRSPNAGWPEAAMAGALSFSLGGPRSYSGELVDLPAMGEGRRDLNAEDIESALALYRAKLNVMLVLVVIVALLLW